MCASLNTNMEHSENLIEVSLLRFINLLRLRGIRISSAETLDALSALTHVDIRDRDEVKAGLSGTLVKDADQMEVFELAFNNFFIPQSERKELTEKHQQQVEQQAEQIEKAQTDLQFQDEGLELNKEDNLAYNEMSSEEQARLQEFLKQTSQGKKVDNKFKPIVESLVKGHIERWKNNSGFKSIEIETSGDQYLDALMSELMEKHPPEASLIHQDMGNIKDEDLPQMNQVIRRLSKKLATKISRRYESAKRSRHVDIRKTIRANLRYGGIPIDLKYRQKKIKKPELLLLCDVSGSMARYSTFSILFIAGLWSVVRRVQLFLFSEDLERVDLTHTAEGMEKFAQQLQQGSMVWGKGTNLNRALSQLNNKFPTAVGGNTVVIIISDTRTLQPGSAANKLKKISQQVKEVIWLNPLPGEQWPKNKTVSLFKRHSQMHLCNTLAQLEAVFKNKLFS
ncbi:VWA domain-containing protein [Metallumcola ferriviriculae]|uniref:VWA domain-containing protein n=1 Tax=Metallumcola ferriviriculae TaxID=3039180 RepID=A0AAU0UMG2_9FIRM|nr:VWA domain-containing protein [Desulfitibacteraceae bacterium MK1]